MRAMAMRPAKLDRAFYERDAETVARDLVGTILVRRYRGREYRARVVETEAYVGEHDLACHAAKGRTRRTEVMFGPGGFAYVYFIYGMHDMLNVVTGREGRPQAVLIRAAEPLDGWEANLSGPGRLTRAMHVTRADNGVDLTGDALYFLRSPADVPQVARSKRIGVDYAGTWKDELLRFTDANSRAVSGPKTRAQRDVLER